MTIAPASHSVFHEITDEHEQIEAMFDRIHCTFAGGRKNLPLIRKLLGEFVEQLKQHFAHEEKGGYFHEVVEMAPRFAPTVTRLREEHIWLQEFIVELHYQSVHAPASAVWWEAIRLDFTEFFTQFNKHEACENNLIQETYTQDIGALD